ncbi:MAG: universal stress protein [Planctomycetaceae bacterium]
MIQLSRILVPTDFSEHSKPALDYACAFAEQFGSELHLVHVLQDLVGLVPEPGMGVPPPGDYVQELTASAEQALAELPSAEWTDKFHVVRATRHGPPFVEIIRYARDQDVDLIVLGTHGRSGLVHVLLGSVAEKVVRKAPCPVLTVRPSGHQFVMP